MKNKLFNLLGASFLGALFVAPLAFAGPSFPFPPAKRPAPSPKAVPACCMTHQACVGKDCCGEQRAYYSAPSGRGLLWNTFVTCKSNCSMPDADQRAVCHKGAKA